MTTMSIRGIDDEVLGRLKQQAAHERTSLNSLVLRLLQGDGAQKIQKAQKFDDLDSLAGTWSDDDAQAFMQATADFDELDPALWK